MQWIVQTATDAGWVANLIAMLTFLGACIGGFVRFVRPRLRARGAKRGAPLIDWLRDRLEHASFLHTPPIDLRATSTAGRVTCHRDGHLFRFGIPENWRETVDGIVRDEEPLKPMDSQESESIRQRLLLRVQKGNFSASDVASILTRGPDSEVLRTLLLDRDAIEIAKRAEFRSYLLGSGGFLFNKSLLSVAQLKILRTVEEYPELEIVLSTTDYFTYRVMSRFSSRIRSSKPFEAFGNNFSEYVAAGVQQGVHLALGLAIVVHTLRDNRAIITRRSAHATNNAGEAGKYFMSVNESLNQDDVSRGGTAIDLYSVVERGLKEELVGDDPGRLLLSRVRTCLLVGAYVYLPNMSIGPCVYVGIDCDSEEIRSLRLLARDGALETTEIIREQRWHKETGLPRFTRQDIRAFIEETVGSRRPQESWDEGALCALALAVHGAYAAGHCR